LKINIKKPGKGKKPNGGNPTNSVDKLKEAQFLITDLHRECNTGDRRELDKAYSELLFEY